MSKCTYTIDGKQYSLPEFKAYLVEGGLDKLYPEGNYPWAAKGADKSLLEQHQSIDDKITEGKITADEMRAEFEKLVSNGDAVMAELSKLTKAELLKRIRTYTRPEAKKQELVEDAYENMITDYWIGDGMFSYSHSFGNNETAAQLKAKKVRKFLETLTDDDIQKRAARVEEAQKERAESIKKAAEGMENPQTLEDFNRLLRAKMESGMTFEQARMSLTEDQREFADTLAADYDRKARAERQKTDVRTTATTTSGDIIETKHTKTGEDLFVVKAADRVDRETYKEWNATAKRLGGWYSSYRGAGAVPGFQFKTRENAEAFLKYLGGDATEAKEAIQERRDAYADDKSQSAVERLNEMADSLEERGEEALNRDRKANTARRAGMAANAIAKAEIDIAQAKTMRNIAKAISEGKAKFLDRVRTKAQVEMLQSFVGVAQYDKIRAKYDSYMEQERHKGEKPTRETADYAKYPDYTAYRSTLAELGRALSENDGTKKLGKQLLDMADDVSDAYLKWAKEHVSEISKFRTSDGLPAIIKSKLAAEESIYRSGYKGAAIPMKFKEGWRIVLSPAEAMKRGIWEGDDKLITLKKEFGAELVEKIGKAARRNKQLSVPWHFETAYDKQKRLASMGIETRAEFRAALREFIALSEAPKEADKIKEMERAMIGRANDGLDFFPTPASIAEQMVETADIKEGMSVLEPSAGMGHIAERIRAAGVEPDVVELSNNRKELLEAKGFNVVGRDFMDVTGQYDRIIMNPPFGDRRDAAHVQHAYDLLSPGGRLVAIMGEGVFFGSDKKAQAFRDWLEERGGTDEKLEEGTFKDPSLPVTTGVNARLVVIDKPETEQPKYSKGQSTGSTVAEITNLLPKRVKALLDAGKLKVVQSHENSQVEAYYDAPNDVLTLVADRISPSSLSSVIAHELIHRGLTVDDKLKSAYDRFNSHMQARFDAAARGQGTAIDKAAYARVINANTPEEYRLEEFSAYQISLYEREPQSLSASLRKAIGDFIAAIRAFLLRNGLDYGFIKSLTPADLAAMSRMYGAKVASSGTKVASSDIRYSKAANFDELRESAIKAMSSLKGESNQELKDRAKGLFNKTIHALDSIGPLKDLPNKDDYLIKRYLTLGKIAKVDEVSKSIYDAFKDAGEDQANVFKFLTDKTVSSRIIKDDKVRQSAVETKRTIIEVGKNLVDRGLLDAETYEANKGEYLPRVYLRHLLDDNAISALGSGKKPSNLGYLKARKDIPEDVRRLILGEITDPGYLASKGYGQQMRDIALLDWIAEIAENKDWILQQSLIDWKGQKVTPLWLKSEAQRIRKQALYYTQENKDEAIALANEMDESADKALDESQAAIAPDGFKRIPDTGRYGKMRGLIVRAEIYDDIVGSSRINTGDESMAEQILGYGGMATKFTQLWKWSKVAANPPAQVRNFISNGILLHLSGVPFHKVPSRVMRAIKEVRSNGEHWQIAKKYGVTESTFSAQELYRIERELLDIDARNSDKVSLATLKNMAGKVMDKTGDIYQFSEAIFKTAKIIDEMEKGSTESKAALEAQKWMFDYSLVTPSMRYLRNAPIGIPFMTFYMKALPRMLEVAATRPLAFAPYIALPMALTALVAGMADVDDDDVDKLKLALPEWLQKRGHAYFIPAKDENGRWQAIDFGYFMPWTMWTELLGSLKNGEFGDAMQASGILGGPITSMISAVQTNTDPFTQKEIINKSDPGSKQIASVMGYLWSLSAPTWVTNSGFAGKMYDAVAGTVDKQGDVKTTGTQALMRLGGVNMYSVNPVESRANNIKRMKYEISETKARRTQLLRDKNLSTEQRLDISNEYNELIVSKTKEMQDYIKASVVHPNLR